LEESSSDILSASMAILPRTAYSIVLRLGDIVSMVRRLVLGVVVAVVVVSVSDVVAFD
jgi:hypothetical protein